ncbi:hypothetical protein [Micromonospora sediminimaris]|uniref:Copper(I)-binding protein n=1 Tax=Micromonospora sediminimaris TaxID=547162 RepID=A0A9W5UTX9_9ACTN|nr:hypothetical protein [Micromonospora sediminimaris]GIJ34496.1 hypothetical protein Vse01_36440 [Micromonospora sediminimaris]SFD39260.1 hypothetical protein SAMN05216284_11610 [Micromonospora sediminimaris]
MTRPTRTLRWASLPGTALVVLLLGGCGAGQIAETAEKEPSIQGVNLMADNGEYAVRGLLIEFPGADGYRAGENALLSAVIYNDSKGPVTVTVTSQDAREVVIVDADRPIPPRSDAAAPRPTTANPNGSLSPDGLPQSGTPQPATGPARIELPPLSFVRFNEQAGRYFQLLDLDESLRSGQNASVTFDFGNGQRVTGPAPVAAALTPVPPPPPVVEPEEAEIHDGADHSD